MTMGWPRTMGVESLLKTSVPPLCRWQQACGTAKTSFGLPFYRRAPFPFARLLNRGLNGMQIPLKFEWRAIAFSSNISNQISDSFGSNTNDISRASQSTESLSSCTEGPVDSGKPLPSVWLTAASIASVAMLVALGGFFKKDIKLFLDAFTKIVEQMGPLGYAAYAGLYTLLELIAVPALPLTMAAGYLFGLLPGVAVVSFSSTAAAVIAFLISRFAISDRIRRHANSYKQFAAIDCAIRKASFKFVFLLRLSPLLPFAASNYLYGLTSVELAPYVLASWLGMLPGTWAYVSAGTVGRNLSQSGAPAVMTWQLVAGILITLGAIWFVGSLAKEALGDVQEENIVV